MLVKKKYRKKISEVSMTFTKKSANLEFTK